MTAPSRQPELIDLTRRALRREAETRLANGDRLVSGEWVPASAAPRIGRRRVWSALRETVEALVFWAVVAAVGLVCMTLVTMVL